MSALGESVHPTHKARQIALLLTANPAVMNNSRWREIEDTDRPSLIDGGERLKRQERKRGTAVRDDEYRHSEVVDKIGPDDRIDPV